MSPSTPEHRANAQRLDRSPLVRPGCVPAATQRAEGERLTPSRGLKKGVRYRYYVSRHLITGDKTEGRGMRLPAPGIEALIRTRIATLLADPEELATMLRAQCDRAGP